MQEQKARRSVSQIKADNVYEAKRRALPRFGGRCTVEQKEQLKRLSQAQNCDEKTLIFLAIDCFEAQINK